MLFRSMSHLPQGWLILRDLLPVLFCLLFFCLIVFFLRSAPSKKKVEGTSFWQMVDMILVMIIIPGFLFSTANIVIQGPSFLNYHLVEVLSRLSFLGLFAWVFLFMIDKAGFFIQD